MEPWEAFSAVLRDLSEILHINFLHFYLVSLAKSSECKYYTWLSFILLQYLSASRRQGTIFMFRIIEPYSIMRASLGIQLGTAVLH